MLCTQARLPVTGRHHNLEHIAAVPARQRVLCLAHWEGPVNDDKDRKQSLTKEDLQQLDNQAVVFGSLSAAARLNPGRTRKTNIVLTSDNSDETWRRLDQKVNKYPGQRSFTAIGTGGTEFRTAMVNAVEKVVGSVHCECVSERTSSAGSYISVTVGPVWVENSEQVIAIYHSMKEDTRLKWFI